MNKMEMSLDDIIKSAKLHAKGATSTKAKGTKAKGAKTKGKSPIKGGVAKRRSAGGQKKAQGVRKTKRAVKTGAATKTKAQAQAKGAKRAVQKKAAPTTSAATKKLVQSLVKKALAKTTVGRVAARTPTKSARRRVVAGRRRSVGVEGRGVLRGRVAKRSVMLEQLSPRMIAPRARIVALPPILQQPRFVQAPVGYQLVQKASRRGNRGRQPKQVYAPAQFIGGGGSIREQIAVMRRQQQPQMVYVQRPVQRQQYIVQPVQRQPQRQQQQFARRQQPKKQQQRNRQQQQQSKVVQAGAPFYDPPNFLQRI